MVKERGTTAAEREVQVADKKAAKAKVTAEKAEAKTAAPKAEAAEAAKS